LRCSSFGPRWSSCSPGFTREKFGFKKNGPKQTKKLKKTKKIKNVGRVLDR
jgi:hypothetical protein